MQCALNYFQNRYWNNRPLMFIKNMYVCVCGFLLGILVSFLRREFPWDLFTYVAPASWSSVASVSLEADLKRPDKPCPMADASSADISDSINSSSFAVTVYEARRAGEAGGADGLTLTVGAVAWAVACVSALASVSVGAHLLAVAAAKRFVLSRFMRPLLSELSQVYHGAPPLPRGSLSPPGNVQLDAVLSSQIDVLDTLQADIQRLGAAGDAEGSWLAWSALLLLLRETRATVAAARARFRRDRRRRAANPAPAPAHARAAAGQPQRDAAPAPAPATAAQDPAQQRRERPGDAQSPSAAEEPVAAPRGLSDAWSARPRPRLRTRRADAPSRRGCFSLQLRLPPTPTPTPATPAAAAAAAR